MAVELATMVTRGGGQNLQIIKCMSKVDGTKDTKMLLLHEKSSLIDNKWHCRKQREDWTN